LDRDAGSWGRGRMSAVSLVSGGLDSSTMAILANEEGLVQFPLFVDYGQKSRGREWNACRTVLKSFNLPAPRKMQIAGFGRLISSGLTDPKKDTYRDAFLPGRNLMFLLCAAAYAVQNHADVVLIGLLNEETHLFPDQTKLFLSESERTISSAMGRKIRICAPLAHLFKSDVIAMARKRGLVGTYSCHRGTLRPCGVCVSCREFLSAKTQ
jgi:7-cyano-7-deazaguanine synthase